MVSKKLLVGSIITVIICLAVSIVCAVIRHFNVVSVVLLSVVVVLGIITAIAAWREIVNQKHEEEI